jgi:hypothetical protein
VLELLPLPALGRLALASRPARHLAVAWVASPSGLRRLANHLNSAADSEARLQLWLALCHQLGVFFKRATMLQHSGARLSELAACYSGLEQLVCAGLAGPWAAVCGKAGLAAALHALALGWDESEYHGIFRLLEGRHPVLARLAGLPSYILQEALGPPQRRRLSELRADLRIFFWEFAPDEATRAGWLAFLLNRAGGPKGSPMFLHFMLGHSETAAVGHQQVLLHRLYEMPGLFLVPVFPVLPEVFPDSYAEAKHLYGDLGTMLRALEARNTELSTGGGKADYIHRIAAHLFEDHPAWGVDSPAACLLFSSEAVVTQYLSGLARDPAWPVVAAELLVAMIVTCERLGNKLNQGLANIVDFAFAELPRVETERKRLIAEFWNELGVRLEHEEDIGVEVIAQLGVHIGLRAYAGAGGKTASPALDPTAAEE